MVLATNIAETGVTIPDVVFVIDTCLVKETRFNENTRIRGLVQCYVPKSSGKQRRTSWQGQGWILLSFSYENEV